MQDALFPDETPASPKRRRPVEPQPPDPEQIALAAALPARAWLGTSSWNYPDWTGIVWDRRYADALLSKHGLWAYSRQPLLRAVSLDRGFYQALTASQYERYAAQLPADFRFTVKAPAW